MTANQENSAVATGLEKVSFHSNPKEKKCQRMFKLLHNCTYLTCQQVQFSSVAQPCPTLYDSMNHSCQASLSITNSQSSPKLMSVESVMPSSHLILCRPLLLLPPIPPSIRVFSNESNLHMRWPSFSISPSKEHPGLISIRMDQLDLLAVQGTLKSLLQHHSSKASILWRSAFFTVQLSQPYMHDHWKNHSLDQTELCWQSNVSAFEYAMVFPVVMHTGKTIPSTIGTFVTK